MSYHPDTKPRIVGGTCSINNDYSYVMIKKVEF